MWKSPMLSCGNLDLIKTNLANLERPLLSVGTLRRLSHQWLPLKQLSRTLCQGLHQSWLPLLMFLLPGRSTHSLIWILMLRCRAMEPYGTMKSPHQRLGWRLAHLFLGKQVIIDWSLQVANCRSCHSTSFMMICHASHCITIADT